MVLDKLWREYHSDECSLPNRNNVIIDAVVEQNGQVVGYGQTRIFAEAMLFLDKSCSTRTRTGVLKLLMSEALRGTERAGIEQLYCFIKDPKFATLISKHFSFEIIEKGELLLREEI